MANADNSIIKGKTQFPRVCTGILHLLFCAAVYNLLGERFFRTGIAGLGKPGKNGLIDHYYYKRMRKIADSSSSFSRSVSLSKSFDLLGCRAPDHFSHISQDVFINHNFCVYLCNPRLNDSVGQV